VDNGGRTVQPSFDGQGHRRTARQNCMKMAASSASRCRQAAPADPAGGCPGRLNQEVGKRRATVASERMAAVLEGITSIDHLTGMLADQAATVAGVSGLGAVLTSAEGTAESIWSSGRANAALSNLQLTLGEGPSVEAARHGVLVLEPDLVDSQTTRWPAFAGAAGELGVGAVFAFPLRVGAIGLGVLELHRDSPGFMSNGQISDVLVLADALTSLLLRLSLDGEFVVLRTAVHQATGMIAVQLGISLDESLVRLRGHAFGSNRPIDEVAADVVAQRLGFTDFL
jgi:hypothetical protein